MYVQICRASRNFKYFLVKTMLAMVLIEYCIMSERQLPADHRSTIRQSFAASLLLTSLFFFWNFLVANEPSRGAFCLYRGEGAVANCLGDRPPVTKAVGDRSLEDPLCKLQLRNFAKNILSLTVLAT